MVKIGLYKLIYAGDLEYGMEYRLFLMSGSSR